MNSIQYEELCRLFLAEKLGISIGEVQSVTMPNSRRPNLPEYKHQIDLYWDDGNELTQYLNIANAKWRSSDKVEQGEVLLLQQVKEDLDAHKAMMITNIGFTEGAKAVAGNKGIALHIVSPSFDHTILGLSPKNRETIQNQLQEFSTSSNLAYDHKTVHRAFELGTSTVAQSSVSVKPTVHSQGIVESPSNRMRQSPSNRRVPPFTKKAPRRQEQAQQRFTRNTSGSANRGR